MRVQCPHPRFFLFALALAVSALLAGAPLSAQEGDTGGESDGAAAEQQVDEGPSGAPGRPGRQEADLDQFMQSRVDSATQTPPYRREVFSYPRGGRIDPTTIPSTIATSGAFPDLKLTGIIHDPQDPSNSRAIVRVLDDTGTRKVVGPGDKIAKSYTVESIEPTRIFIEVQLLGRTRRLVLDRGQSTNSPSSTDRPSNGN